MTGVAELLVGLAEANVRFVVVGHVAIVLHGYLQLTAERSLRVIVPDAMPECGGAIEAIACADFEPLWSRANVIHIEPHDVRVASIADLIAMKRASGTLQDLADLDALESLAALDDTAPTPWPDSFAAARREQLRAWRATTIDERLRWLDEADALVQLVRRSRP